MIGNVRMLADRGHQYAGSLPAGFFQKQLHHRFAVVVIQVADGFVEQDKIQRLAKCTNDGYALLLPEG